MERPLQVAGSAVVCSMEGTRPILVELQALVSRSFLAVPRRTTIGVDHNRVALLVAVLEKKMGAKLFDQDIFVNVAGGVNVDEPAVDFGIVAAISFEQPRSRPRSQNGFLRRSRPRRRNSRHLASRNAGQRSRQTRLRALHPAGEQRGPVKAHQTSQTRRRQLDSGMLEAALLSKSEYLRKAASVAMFVKEL